MGNIIFEGIINNLNPIKGKLNIIGNDTIKTILEKCIQNVDHFLINSKIDIDGHIFSYEIKCTYLNNEMKFEGNMIDENGFYKKGKFFEFPIKGELIILEFTEEGMKGKLKMDLDIEKYEGETLNCLSHGKGTIQTDDFSYDENLKMENLMDMVY